MKVLLVGESHIYTQLKELLSTSDYQVTNASYGKEALDVLQSNMEPLLVLINSALSDMTGIKLCEALKKSSGKGLLYIMLLSPAHAKGLVAPGFEQGVDDYITLPVEPEEITNRLALGKRILDYQSSVEQLTKELNEKDSQLSRFAARDQLTGVAGKNYFTERLDEELRRCGRFGQPLSLIIFDVDNFKDYNGSYGMAAGDECLKTLAHIVTSSVSRGGDFVARYGDGFVVMLPNTDALGALVVAESIRVAVSIQNIEHQPSGVNGRVTVSAGTLTVTPEKNMNGDSLIAKVEQVLYNAKESGRNIVKQTA